MHRIKRACLTVGMLSLLLGCTVIPPDVTFLEEGSSGSASVEIDFQSESKVELVFPSSGGTATVAIKATGDWTADISGGGNIDWCSFTPAEGTNANSSVKVSVSANDTYMDRNCSISIRCGENRRTLVVTQKQKDALFLTPAKVEVPAGGGSFEVEVRHNTEFSYEVSKSATDWILPAGTRGLTADKVRFEVLENPNSDPREGDVSFTSGSAGSETVHVYQEGMSPCIVLTQKDFQVGCDGGTVTVEIKSNVDYECSITEGSSWLKETSTRSMVSTHTRTFAAASNPDDVSRTGKIVFSDRANGLSETVTVRQEGRILFSLDSEKVELEPEGGRFEVRVTSTVGYKVSSMPEWIMEDPSSTRAETRTHVFTAVKNTVDEIRSGVIVFCNDLGVCVPVSVSQKPRVIGVDWNKDFYHRSLFMRVTATWCNWCPRMARGVYLSQDLFPDKIVHVALHGSDSDLAFSGSSRLISQYRISAYPTGIVDGRVEVRSAPEDTVAVKTIAASKETESLYGTKTGIQVSSSLSGRKLSVETTVFAKKSGDYKVTVLLLEDGILHYQAPEQGLYLHNDIARITLTDIRGDAFSVSKDHGFKDFYYSVDIPTSYDLQNMKVLVYVQNAFGSSPKVQTGNYGDYYVDNALVVPFGMTYGPEMVASVSGGNEGIIPDKDIEP